MIKPRAARDIQAASAASFSSARQEPSWESPRTATTRLASAASLEQLGGSRRVRGFFHQHLTANAMRAECVFQRAAKQLSFERVRANVIVMQRSRVHDAANDECGAAHVQPGLSG